MLLKLILENYVPLLSSGIHKVELDTKHMINLFISANGSGKTSILKEANPNPPENSNYKDGRKYSLWKVHGKLYECDSYTGKGNGHSFKVYEPGQSEGTELNTGGTYTVQKDLCWEYLKVDMGLSKFFAGLRISDRFSAMSPARRKDLIMQVYPNDTDYAMGVYNKLRNERNDLKAAIKNQAQRYAEEHRKLQAINECGVEQLEQRIKNIDDELKQAVFVRGQLENAKIDPSLRTMVNEFETLTSKLIVNQVSGFIYTFEELTNQIQLNELLLERHQYQAAVLEGIILENSGFLDGMEEFLKDPDVFKEQAAHLQEDAQRVRTEIASWTMTLSQYPVFCDPEEPLDGLVDVAGPFMEYLRRVTPASSPSLTGTVYKGALVKHDQNIVTLKQMNSELDQVRHDLSHIENMELLECPDCTHRFKRGVTPEQVRLLGATKTALQDQIHNIEQQQVILQRQIENDAEWYQSMNQLFTWIRANDHVKILPELVKHFDIGKGSSERLLNALHAFLERDKLQVYNKTLEAEEAILNARLGLLEKQNVMDVAVYVASTEKELAQENRKISFFKKKLERLNADMATISNHRVEVARVDQLRHQILKALAEESRVTFRRSVDDRISDLTEDKDHHMCQIIQSKSLTAVVESIESDIARLKRRLLIVETLMDGLCPNKGLLGKLMIDFIKAVCGNVNAALKEIWNTTLYMKHCGKENGDLTYKFPVVTGDFAPSPDVADCSGGETEIIDWIMRKVLMSYHWFPFPLIMDEVGVFLDEVKRGRLLKYLRDYTNRPDARQLFMVSHYFSQYGGFDNPNVIALRYEGLTLTGEVNKHSTVS